MPKAIRDAETGALVFHLMPEEIEIKDLQSQVKDMGKKLENIEDILANGELPSK